MGKSRKENGLKVDMERVELLSRDAFKFANLFQSECPSFSIAVV